MGNQADKKFTWVIKNFSSLNSESDYSHTFVAGRCKWRLLAKKFNHGIYLALCLCVPNSESLPSGWRRHAKFSFTIVNQIPGELSQLQERQSWFDQQTTTQGFESMFRLFEFQGRDNRFLVNGEVKIVAEVDVLVESVNSLFEKYPGFASKLCPNNPHLRKTYLNVVLSLTEILCKSPEKLSIGDLVDAYSALRFVTKAGFKLDWLEKKLKETGENRLQEIEEDLKYLKLKCTDMDALVEFLR